MCWLGVMVPSERGVFVYVQAHVQACARKRGSEVRGGAHRLEKHFLRLVQQLDHMPRFEERQLLFVA